MSGVAVSEARASTVAPLLALIPIAGYSLRHLSVRFIILLERRRKGHFPGESKRIPFRSTLSNISGPCLHRLKQRGAMSFDVSENLLAYPLTGTKIAYYKTAQG